MVRCLVKDWKLHEILRASTVSVQCPFFRNVTPHPPSPAATATGMRRCSEAACWAAASEVAPGAMGANAVAGRCSQGNLLDLASFDSASMN